LAKKNYFLPFLQKKQIILKNIKITVIMGISLILLAKILGLL
jgi:hypothetical protein